MDNTQEKLEKAIAALKEIAEIKNKKGEPTKAAAKAKKTLAELGE